MKPGTIVIFKEMVFKEPFIPYFDSYKDHLFVIERIYSGDHLELRCITDPLVVVDGFVDSDLVERRVT